MTDLKHFVQSWEDIVHPIKVEVSKVLPIAETDLGKLDPFLHELLGVLRIVTPVLTAVAPAIGVPVMTALGLLSTVDNSVKALSEAGESVNELSHHQVALALPSMINALQDATSIDAIPAKASTAVNFLLETAKSVNGVYQETLTKD